MPSKEGGVPNPAGTLVERVPFGTCEFEWQSVDTALGILLRLDLGTAPGTLGPLYAVVKLEPLTWLESVGVASPQYGLIYGHDLGVLLAIDDGAITYIDMLCGGPPALFFADPVREQCGQLEIILRGPGFED